MHICVRRVLASEGLWAPLTRPTLGCAGRMRRQQLGLTLSHPSFRTT